MVGDIRVQAISADVVRIERRGPFGFEDRATLLLPDRSSWLGAPLGNLRRVDKFIYSYVPSGVITLA